jgi:uncharacterized protein (TIGR03083 family)
MYELGTQLTDEEWATPTEVPGWSVQDNLTHIAGLEWQLLGRPRPEHTIPDDLPHVKNEFGRHNEIWVDSRRSRTGAQVLEEFQEVTSARLAQLRGFGPADFEAESFTPVGPGTVRDLLPFRIFDSWVHEQDMRRAVHRPGNLDSRVADLVLTRIASTMPFVVGKKAGAPDGATVVVDLGGPLSRTISIGVEGGRASLLDDTPTDPTTRIVMDTETCARLANGRVTPADTMADGRVRFEGDADLGARVVEQMSFVT